MTCLIALVGCGTVTIGPTPAKADTYTAFAANQVDSQNNMTEAPDNAYLTRLNALCTKLYEMGAANETGF